MTNDHERLPWLKQELDAMKDVPEGFDYDEEGAWQDLKQRIIEQEKDKAKIGWLKIVKYSLAAAIWCMLIGSFAPYFWNAPEPAQRGRELSSGQPTAVPTLPSIPQQKDIIVFANDKVQKNVTATIIPAAKNLSRRSVDPANRITVTLPKIKDPIVITDTAGTTLTIKPLTTLVSAPALPLAATDKNPIVKKARIHLNKIDPTLQSPAVAKENAKENAVIYFHADL